MTIESTNVQARFPQTTDIIIQNSIRKDLTNIKTIKLAKKVFVALAIFFASAAIIPISIGTAIPSAIIAGIALICVIAAKILQSKNNCTHSYLAYDLDKVSVLPNNIQSNLFDVLLDKSIYHIEYSLVLNLNKFTKLSDEKKLNFANTLIESEDSFHHKILFSHLSNFPTLTFENIKTLIDKLLKLDSQFLFWDHHSDELIAQLSAAIASKKNIKEEQKTLIEKLKNIKIRLETVIDKNKLSKINDIIESISPK